MKNKIWLSLARVICAIAVLIILIPVSFNQFYSLAHNHQTTISLSPSELSRLSRLVTVRLQGEYVSGSGVIISRYHNEYQVLTCAHVVDSDILNKGYQVLTGDAMTYSASRNRRFNFGNLDLAIVNFSSNRNYTPVKIAFQDDLSLKSSIYVAGFPNYRYVDGNWEHTYSLGVNYFRFEKGILALSINKPMEKGYQMGLSNDIQQGMSGGPVFNSKLELVGIIGRSQLGIGGTTAYKFADGSYPSPSLLSRMESVSWAIPLRQFSSVLKTSS